MKDLVIVLGSSSIATPQHPDHRRWNHHQHSAKYKPNSSLPKLSPSEKPPAIPTSQSRSHLASQENGIKYDADVASKLAEAGRLEEFAAVVERVIAKGVDASNFGEMLSVERVSKGIAANFCEGKVESVVEVLMEIDRVGIAPVKLIDNRALDSIKKELERMVDSGMVKKAVDLIEVLAGFRFKVEELVAPSNIVNYCVGRRNPKLAIRYACLLPNEQIMFCSIVREFGKRGRMVSAWVAYEESKKHMSSPNMYLYRTIIDVCGRCGDCMKSRIVYEELLNQKVTPNIYVFNSLMNANSHDLGYILDIYKNMKDLGITADIASYNIILKACSVAGKVDLAQEMFNEVKHLESSGVVKLDVFTYCTMIKVFADARMWRMALKIKEDMLSAGVMPNMVTWSSLISACANAGLVELATNLFEEMLLSGCEPNSQCCNILLHAHIEARQYDKAFRLFNCWMRRTYQENSHLHFNSKTDSVSAAEELNTSNSSDSVFSKKFPFTPTTDTYNILMKACSTNYNRAKALMNEMRSLGLSPNRISWSTLIDSCAASGNVQGALRILNTMRLKGIKPDIVEYTTAIKVCVKSKNPNLAYSLYEEMKRYRVQPNLVTYNTLLRARSRYGSSTEVQQCLAIYQDMRKAGYNSNDYYLKQLIEEWCEGVITENYRNQEVPTTQQRTEMGKTYSLLLEKVSSHLQCDAETMAIDLQGLTKVEARIVVLAVLRMIKENYIQGNSVNDDVMIIIGVPGVLDAGPTPTEPKPEVKDAIIKLLKNELGLEVLLDTPRATVEKATGMPKLSYPHLTLDYTVRDSELPVPSLSSATRRPVTIQRLKITKRSLLRWLQQRKRR